MTGLSVQELLSINEDYPVCFKDNQPVYFQQVKSRVAALHRQLANRKEQNWILASNSSLNFLCGFLALLNSGKEILLPPNNLPGTINETINNAEALLTDLEFKSHLPRLELVTAESDADLIVASIDSQKAFIQICTSGSTGEPKQVRKALQTLENEIQGLELKWHSEMQDKVIISTVSHQHIYGLLFRVLWPLFTRRPFVEENIEYPEQIEAYARQYQQLVLISSPAYLKRMASILNPIAMQSVQMIFSSGGPLAHDTAIQYKQMFSVTPVEVLGSTETGGIAWRQQRPDDEIAWQRFADVQIRRQDENGALEVCSPYCFSADWFQMGDAVELIDDEHFRLLGRLDRIVKLEEKRISLDRMEASLVRSELVEQAKVLPLEGYRTILGAVCILSQSGQALLASQGRRILASRLRDELAGYFDRVTLPRKWRYVADFPYNAQGKITRADLIALFLEEGEGIDD